MVKKLIYMIFFLIILAGCQNYDDVTDSKNKPILSPYSTDNSFEITLYYPNKSMDKLIPKTRQIEEITNNLEIEILERLIEGIDDSNIKNLIPKNTKVRSLDISDQIAYINLSSEVKRKDLNQKEEALLVYSIVNTITQLDSVNSVQLLIDGERSESLANYYSIENPLKYSELIVSNSYVDPLETVKKYYEVLKDKDANKLADIFRQVDKKSRVAYGMQYINNEAKKYDVKSYNINKYNNSILLDVKVELTTTANKTIEKNHVFSLVYSHDENIFKINEIYE